MNSKVESLCNASARGDMESCLHLLHEGAAINGQNQYRRTPLQVVKLGHTRLVRTLLAAGANPNERDPLLRLTVTHDAAREGFVETVRALIEYGADVNLADDNGNLPLHLAEKEGHVEVVQLLERAARAREALTEPGSEVGHEAAEWPASKNTGTLDLCKALNKHPKMVL
ncbi:cyclin-dependent kinase 4 inhibitor C [Austrofundulus limnaeus]|uniref:Cyclin-dependent kinase 4 inhibitor C n=1 Tax=Austrofundulus limnaeus TaxID=52670 RepID=A0A2I4CNP4_AUSLI|nr:PREDICTED: cyclin-dependent kinase 4 inhibitor C-like [Austrofundulus limnaeus]